MKKIISLMLLLACLLSVSCGDRKAGLGEPVKIGNISVTVTDMYSDGEYNYAVALLKFEAPDSYTDGIFTSGNVSGGGEGGYNYSLIGCDKEAQTQTYLIGYHPALERGKLEIELHKYCKRDDIMFEISDARYNFSVNTADSKKPVKTIDVNDGAVEQIQIFSDLVILKAANDGNKKYTEFKDYEIKLFDKSGAELEPECISSEIKECRMVNAFILLKDDSGNVGKITLGELEYRLD